LRATTTNVGGRLLATYSTPTTPRDFYAAVHTFTDVNQHPARKRGAGAFVFGDGRWHVEIIRHIQATHKTKHPSGAFLLPVIFHKHKTTNTGESAMHFEADTET